MTRLFTSGFETTLAGDGWSSTGTPTIVTSPRNNGAFACQINALGEEIIRSVGFDTSEASWYVRTYLNVNALPASGNARLLSHCLTSGPELWRCTLTAAGTLQARSATPADIGSPSAALSLDTWYILETRTLRRAAGNDEVEARVYLATDPPGASFVTDTGTDRGWGGGAGRIIISSDDIASTFYVDDVGINDTVGGDSWLGPAMPQSMEPVFNPIPFT